MSRGGDDKLRVRPRLYRQRVRRRQNCATLRLPDCPAPAVEPNHVQYYVILCFEKPLSLNFNYLIILTVVTVLITNLGTVFRIVLAVIVVGNLDRTLEYFFPV